MFSFLDEISDQFEFEISGYKKQGELHFGTLHSTFYSNDTLSDNVNTFQLLLLYQYPFAPREAVDF